MRSIAGAPSRRIGDDCHAVHLPMTVGTPRERRWIVLGDDGQHIRLAGIPISPAKKSSV